MTGSPRIELRNEQPYVAIPITAYLSDWGAVNALIPEVLRLLADKHTKPAGPLLYRYLVATDPDSPFTVEVGFPTDKFIPCEGRAHPNTIPAGRYASYRHVGHPDKLQDSFGILERWIDEQHEQPEADTVDGQQHWAGRFEFYLTNPEEHPDPNDWEIDLAWKLRAAGAPRCFDWQGH